MAWTMRKRKKGSEAQSHQNKSQSENSVYDLYECPKRFEQCPSQELLKTVN